MNLWIFLKNRYTRLLALILCLSLAIAIFLSTPFHSAGIFAQVNPIQVIPAQISKKNLTVATGIIKPFVFKNGDELVGFSIDLWKDIAAEIGVDFKFQLEPNIAEVLQSVKTKKADLAIAAISVTKERDKEFDFSYPIFEGGLQIMVPAKAQANTTPNFFANLFSPSLFQLLGVVLLASLIPVHLVWWFERDHENGITDKAYFPGIFKAFWWVLSTLATQADEMPKSWLSRIVAIFWMFVSVVFVAFFTATVTTALTVQQLQGSIQSVSDLPGKRVVAIAGSTSESYLKDQNISTIPVKVTKEGYDLMLNGEADAMVFDSPVLKYYAANEGKGKLQVAGDVFQKENYGITFPLNSPYRRAVNNALLTLNENGVYGNLYQKWFADKTDKSS
jgi:polar amino acid transport system substrate-binding protein